MSEPHIEHNYALPAALRKYAQASSHPSLNYPTPMTPIRPAP